MKDNEAVSGPLTDDELAEVAELQLESQELLSESQELLSETQESVAPDVAGRETPVQSDEGPEDLKVEVNASHQDASAPLPPEMKPMAEVVHTDSVTSATVSVKDNQMLFGAKEWAYLPGTNKSFVADVDPEIDLSLIRVTDMTVFERNGKEWVTFSIGDVSESKQSEMNLPVSVWLEKRPVVTTWVQVGELRDRSNFVLMKKQPDQADMVLGKNVLNDKVVVDPGRQYVQVKK